jgi:hypothetical protein
MRFIEKLYGPQIYEYRYKRKPKLRSIENVHDLWVRSCERASARQKIRSNFLKKITEEIPKDDNGYHIAYFYQEGHIRFYKISYEKSYGCHGVSTDSFDASKKSRDEILSFILAEEKSFQLGQHYYELNKLDTKHHHIVERAFIEMINNFLREKFNGQYIRSEKIFIIKIGQKEYYVQSDAKSSSIYYHKFNLLDEHINCPIEIK